MRTFALSLLLAGFLHTLVSNYTSLLAADAETGSIILQVQWYPQAQFAGYLAAVEKGFYKEAGLDEVKIEWFITGAPPLQRLSEGQIDFCTAWLSQGIAAYAEGEDIVNIAQLMQKSSLMLVARKESGIRRPEDMTGKRVGVWADFWVQFDAFFRKFDVRPDLIKQSYSIAPFLRGAVDVVSAMYYNEYHRLLEAGLREDELIAFRFSDYGMNFPEDGIYCRAETRRDQPELCTAFVSASIRGWAWALSNEKEALDVVMKYCDRAHMPTNRNHQRWMLRAMGESIRYRVGTDPENWGALDTDAYENVSKILIQHKVINSAPSYEELYRPAMQGGGTTP
jgi:NitT/TauT family transport system substrate-binding protein